MWKLLIYLDKNKWKKIHSSDFGWKNTQNHTNEESLERKKSLSHQLIHLYAKRCNLIISHKFLRQIKFIIKTTFLNTVIFDKNSFPIIKWKRV
jgi:hypothetical protein